MLYYDTKQQKEQTESQIKRRGLIKSGVSLSELGIFALATDNPEGYDSEIHALSVAGYSETEDGYKKDWELGYKSVSVVKAILAARLAEKRYNIEVGGIEWSGNKVDTDRDSQPKIFAEYVSAVNGLRSDGEYWKMADGSCVSLTNEELISMATAVRTHVASCYTREAEIKTLVEAEETAEAKYTVFVAEFDSGWPDSVAA